MLLLLSADFSKNSFGNTIRVSNRLDPDQDQHLFESRKRKAFEILEHLVFTINIFLSPVHHRNVTVVRRIPGKFTLLHQAFS